jgi:hypothetical protein
MKQQAIGSTIVTMRNWSFQMKFHFDTSKLENMCMKAILEAHAAGVPAYYTEPEIDGMIRSMPDGSRQIVELLDGQDVVVRDLPPRLLD